MGMEYPCNEMHDAIKADQCMDSLTHAAQYREMDRLISGTFSPTTGTGKSAEELSKMFASPEKVKLAST